MAGITTLTRKTNLNVILGAMTFGAPDRLGQSKVHELKDVEAIVDVFLKHGHREVDTARLYAEGTSEEFLGKIGWQQKDIKMGTKLFPVPTLKITHSPEDLRKFLNVSLKALNTDKIDLWYLHGPDRSTPYEETLRGINELYKEGYFTRFGISNYMSWEVAEIVAICKRFGYVQPSVYQGVYNAIQRVIEPELLPCLRKFGISFYAFNPLAGGLLSGRYSSIDAGAAGRRFDTESHQGKAYRDKYWNPTHFAALAHIQRAVEPHNLTLAEVALRWLSHHSLMRAEHGDSVLIGSSSVDHIEQNLLDLEKGPLSEDVVKALDEAWADVKGIAKPYYF
ncbi:Aldo/keto reductase [Roridomyces roridus]|uniref:Aldo/keto reductase n=1 Tax=Roridomyces roridus TaxID=1738132 RepID=A0AAD7FCF0_9AGAR|nr:Aldo/keto reductase [Roridomyces roridus]